MIIAPLIAGIVGTFAMTLFLMLPRWLHRGKVDVIGAVGALITGKTEGAAGIGFAIHFLSGIVFAYVYYFSIKLSGFPLNWGIFTLAGAIHGVIAMLLVAIVIMEHHPIARFHDRGPMTGIMQLFAHIVYGAVIGLVIEFIGVAK